MLKRNDKGLLVLQFLDVMAFLDDLYNQCKTEDEVNWLRYQITFASTTAANVRKPKINNREAMIDE